MNDSTFMNLDEALKHAQFTVGRQFSFYGNDQKATVVAAYLNVLGQTRIAEAIEASATPSVPVTTLHARLDKLVSEGKLSINDARYALGREPLEFK